MSHRNSRRTAIALSLAAAVFAIGAASAEDRAPVLSKTVADAMKRDLRLNDAQLAQYFTAERTAFLNEARLARQLGDRYAGGWLERGADGGYRYVVASTGAVRGAKIAGVELRQSRHSLRQLEGAVERLNRVHALSNKGALQGVHAWGVDLPSNSVVVSVAPGYALNAIDFVAVSGIDAGLVRFETSQLEAPTPFVNVIGGIAYSSGGGRCSIGFAATRSGAKGFATAGHCGGVGTTVGISGTTVGSVQARYYPGGDMAWASVRSSDTLVGQVSKYNGTVQRVLGRTEAAVGAAICRSGSTTGWRCGTVTRKNVSANYGAGTVSGLTQSTACAGQGDSGGSWITGSGQAQGVTSGGQLPAGSNNNCSVATPVTFFQPINPLISRFGLTLTLG
ncbi:MAG: S1 family peptidase [Lysobacter sp.]|nr:S1 family peptidase [Lysobacter sp.]